MSKIDATARVEDGAIVGDNVTIGPYCIIGPNVTLRDNTTLMSHVNVAGETTIGAGSTIYPFASLGTPPQSLSYKGELTKLEIGEGCTIREGVTMNTGTVGGGGITRVGDRCFFMSNSHVGHDCIVGNDVIFASSGTLGGHCEVGNSVFFGGLSAAHQFVRIGSQAMVAGMSGLRGDVIPYAFVTGQNAHLDGLNVVGMRRRKFTKSRLHAVRAFYNAIFFGPGIFAERLEKARPMAGDDPAIGEIIAFIDANNKRPLTKPYAENAEAHE